MRIKRGDTLPALVINLTDGDVAVNLTSATAVKVIGKRGTVAAFTDTNPTRDNPAGKVTHTWLAAETAIAGRIAVEVEVTWPGGAPQTFPNSGYLVVTIVDDLG